MKSSANPLIWNRMIAGILGGITLTALTATEANAQRVRWVSTSNGGLDPIANPGRSTIFEVELDQLVDQDSSSSRGFYRGAIQNFVIFNADLRQAQLDEAFGPAYPDPNAPLSDFLDQVALRGFTPVVSFLEPGDFGDLTTGDCCIDNSSSIDYRELLSIDPDGSPRNTDEFFHYSIEFPNNNSRRVVLNLFLPDALGSSQLVNSVSGLESFIGQTVIGFVDSNLDNESVDGFQFKDDFNVRNGSEFFVTLVNTEVPEPATTTSLLALGTAGTGYCLRRRSKQK